MSRFEIVRTDAGWHSRFRGWNGKIIWTTEVYTRRRAALRAVELIAGAPVKTSPYADHPEVEWRGNGDYPTEVHEVDERGAS